MTTREDTTSDGYPPPGLGVYVWQRELDQALGDPGHFAAHLSANHVSWCAILGVWQDDTRGHVEVDPDQIATVAEALRRNGVEPWVWFYPHPSYVDELEASLVRIRDAAGPAGWGPDPEEPWKGQPASAMEDMLGRTIDTMREGMGLFVTSYGAPWWHSSLPWGAMCAGGGSPQVYLDQPGLTPDQIASYVRRCCEAWLELGWTHLWPSIPTYGERAATGAALLDYCETVAAQPGVEGLVAWSWRQTSAAEWAALSRWARRAAE